MNTEILFNFKDQITCIKGEINLSMKDNFKAFINKLKLNDINLRFEFKNEPINDEIVLKEFLTMNKIENNQIEIIVIEEDENENKILSEEVICPETKQEARIIVTDDKVTFITEENHIKEIPKSEFKKSQMISQSKTKCKCNSNKKKLVCLTCNESLCLSCEKDHKQNNNDHIIMDYAQKKYCCLKHKKCKNQFNYYCQTCQQNLCWICYDSHKNHQIENLNEIYELKDKLISKQKDFSLKLKNLEQAFEEFKKHLDNLKSAYEMNEIIIKNYNIENRNYTKLINYKEIYENNFNLQKIEEFLINLTNITKININYQEININNAYNSIKNEEMIKEQNQIIKECSSIISFNLSQELSVSHTSFNIQRLYEKIENYNMENINIDLSENDQNNNEDEEQNYKGVKKRNFNKNEIENENENEEQNDEEISEEKINNNINNIESLNDIIYENKNNEDDNILSIIKENEDNKDEEYINSYDKKESKDEDYHNNENNKRIIQKKNLIKLTYINKDDKKIKIFGKNFVKMNRGKCKIKYKNQDYDLTEYFDVLDDHKGNLEIFLEGIDKITDASEMFSDCSLLVNLEDISEWDTSNITNMSKMFENCKSLIPFPDISKWNLINVTRIQYMLYGCKYLESLPDLSGWNTYNIINMSHLFENCESLLSLPNISKWNFINVTNIEFMFCGCKSLKSLPDLSTWKTNNITNMSNLFGNCRSLSSFPDLSRWSTNNLINMSHLFERNESLLNLPDISKWDVTNVTHMEFLFFGCLKLTKIIIFKKVYNVEDISYLYYGCHSLLKEPDLSEWNLNKIKKKENFNGNCFKLKK